MHTKHLLYSVSLGLLAFGSLVAANSGTAKADDQTTASDAKQVLIDGKTIDTNPANAYKGFGMVSANGTSRLLMDYKSKHPDQYWKIMKQLFDPQTGALNFIKVEMGADLNTSTATTPATMRSADEPANTLRGWDWHIVADAKKINPNLEVDALRWSEPKWVQDAEAQSKEAGYAARYKWFRNTLISIYDTYGVKLNYLSADKNETKTPEPDWIIYLSQHLKDDKNAPYDFSKIKIVASDQIGGTTLATQMKTNTDLRNAVDAISYHYQSHASDDIQLMNQTYHKQIWYSEGVAPSGEAEFRNKINSASGGLGGQKGALDVANTFINMYRSQDLTSGKDVSAYMTRYEYQPAIGSFYDGGQYSTKNLVDAETPWSGNYYVDAGLPVTQQFTEFAKPGWQYFTSASYGVSSGNNPYTKSTDNRLALTSADKKDYSVVITNDSTTPRTYTYSLKNMPDPAKTLQVWQTSGPKSGERYDANWLKQVGKVTPQKQSDGSYKFTYTVAPNSVVTLSTTTGQTGYQANPSQKLYNDDQLALPYTDDFEYSDSKYQNYKDTSVLDSSKQGYFASRDGGSPRYFDDIGGAFSVVKSTDPGHGNVMQGMINNSNHAAGEWNSKPGNDSVMGDARWANYKVSADFKLDTTSEGSTPNYAALLTRNQITKGGDDTGYQFKIYRDGTAKLTKDGTELKSATIKGFNDSKWHTFVTEVNGNAVTDYLDGKQIFQYTDDNSPYTTGRIGLNSGYYLTQFDNLKVEPIQGKPSAVQRYDDADSSINYSGDWTNGMPTGADNFNRSLYTSPDGSGSVSFNVKGTGFNLVGATSPATLRITVDGKVVAENQKVNKTSARATSYTLTGLTNGDHQVKVDVTSGKFSLDAVDDYLAPASVTPTPNNNGGGSSNSSSVASPSSSTTSSSSSSNTSDNGNGGKTPTIVVPKSAAKKGSSIYLTRNANLYKGADFKSGNRIAEYKATSRTHPTKFVVIGYARSSNGTLRYKVRDANSNADSAGRIGYLTANRKYVQDLYFGTRPASNKVTVISKHGINSYRNVGLTHKVKHYRKGTHLTVKKLVKHGFTTRYQLNNGRYISANKAFVMQGLH